MMIIHQDHHHAFDFVIIFDLSGCRSAETIRSVQVSGMQLFTGRPSPHNELIQLSITSDAAAATWFHSSSR